MSGDKQLRAVIRRWAHWYKNTPQGGGGAPRGAVIDTSLLREAIVAHYSPQEFYTLIFDLEGLHPELQISYADYVGAGDFNTQVREVLSHLKRRPESRGLIKLVNAIRSDRPELQLNVCQETPK